jgi:tetrahydrodipicolinate N-succinyltransferase
MKKLLIALALSLSVSTLAFAAGMSVEDVNKQMKELEGKQVTVTGKVVKVNNGIMKRNFLHIQDGTGGQGTNDLTVTSSQTAKVGSNVTITGTVVLGTDFGMGYSYPLLVEKSTIVVNK